MDLQKLIKFKNSTPQLIRRFKSLNIYKSNLNLNLYFIFILNYFVCAFELNQLSAVQFYSEEELLNKLEKEKKYEIY